MTHVDFLESNKLVCYCSWFSFKTILIQYDVSLHEKTSFNISLNTVTRFQVKCSKSVFSNAAAMISLSSDMESDNRFSFCEIHFYVYINLFFLQNALKLVKRVSLKSKNIVNNNKTRIIDVIRAHHLRRYAVIDI